MGHSLTPTRRARYVLGSPNMEKTVNRISALARRESVEPAGPDDSAGDGRARLRRVESARLFERGREVIIVHRDQEYHLRITKSDKLILTK